MDGSTETVSNGKETMKKQVLLITWILIPLLAACGGGATEAPAAPTSTPTTAPAKHPAPGTGRAAYAAPGVLPNIW